jgi:hypothetical protein
VKFRFNLFILTLQDGHGQLQLVTVPDAVAQVREHGFDAFQGGVVEQDVPFGHIAIKAPGVLRQKIEVVLQHLVNAGSVLLQRNRSVTLKILRQEMIVHNIHQYAAVLVKLFAEAVLAGKVHRVRIGKGIDLTVQPDALDHTGRQAAEVVAMHGVGNEIPDDQLIVAEG